MDGESRFAKLAGEMKRLAAENDAMRSSIDPSHALQRCQAIEGLVCGLVWINFQLIRELAKRDGYDVVTPARQPEPADSRERTMTDKPDDARKISRAEFDRIARQQGFCDGPWVSSFGDGPGDPYVPQQNRDVWGRLSSGEAVWADSE